MTETYPTMWCLVCETDASFAPFQKLYRNHRSCQQKPHPVWEMIELVKWHRVDANFPTSYPALVSNMGATMNGARERTSLIKCPPRAPRSFLSPTAYKSLLRRSPTSVHFLQIAESRQQSGYLDKGPMEFFLRGCKSWRWRHEEPNKLL